MGTDLTDRVKAANGGTDLERPTVAGSIRNMQDQFALAMPRGMEAAQLVRDALTALRTTRNLAQCDQASVLGGLMTCAQLGLRPGVLGHAWLLPFWDSHAKSHRAQLIIGYQGYRELADRTGQIQTLIGRVVHEHDTFDIDYGTDDRLIHKPKLNGDRGEPVGYYTIVKYTTGGHAFWHMTKADVEAHRDRFAMAKKIDRQTKAVTVVGPWRDHFDEMALKTTFLRLAKWMPKSTDLAAAIEADETVRVDLTPDNMDAMLHGQHPDIEGEFEVDPAPADQGEGGGSDA
jgi:recombination protein RecT